LPNIHAVLDLDDAVNFSRTVGGGNGWQP
jgi:hypothetical protein